MATRRPENPIGAAAKNRIAHLSESISGAPFSTGLFPVA
jgi:hypothetical protein